MHKAIPDMWGLGVQILQLKCSAFGAEPIPHTDVSLVPLRSTACSARVTSTEDTCFLAVTMHSEMQQLTEPLSGVPEQATPAGYAQA